VKKKEGEKKAGGMQSPEGKGGGGKKNSYQSNEEEHNRIDSTLWFNIPLCFTHTHTIKKEDMWPNTRQVPKNHIVNRWKQKPQDDLKHTDGRRSVLL